MSSLLRICHPRVSAIVLIKLGGGPLTLIVEFIAEKVLRGTYETKECMNA